MNKTPKTLINTALKSGVIYADYCRSAFEAFVSSAKMFGPKKRKGVSPVYNYTLQGTTAAVSVVQNKVTLYLPALKAEHVLSRNEADYLTGLWLHELAHVLFTDFDVWHKAVREGLGQIVNGLEDLRIEKRMASMKEKPRIVETISPILEDMLSRSNAIGTIRGQTSRVKYLPSNTAQLPFTLALYGRLRHGKGYHVPSAPVLEDHVSAKEVSVIDHYTKRAINAADTLEVLDLAREMHQLLQSPPPEEMPFPCSGQGKGESEGEDDDKGKGKGENEDGSGPSGGGGLFGCDISDDNTDANELTIAQSLDDVQEPEQGGYGANEVICSYRGVDTAKLFLVSPLLANKVKNALRSSGSGGKVRRRTRGRLDVAALPRGVMGETDTFYRKTRVPASCAAVSILIDISSSMTDACADINGKRSNLISEAVKMTETLGDCISQAGAPFEVLAYGNSKGHSSRMRPTCTLFEVKTFSETWKLQRRMVQFLRQSCQHGTYILPAMLGGAERLLNYRDATRRIVFILTDGMDIYPPAANMRAAEILAQKGVTVCAIGLNAHVGHLVADPRHAVTLSNAGELTSRAFGVLLEALPKPY